MTHFLDRYAGTFIIAEAGVNHDGQLSVALELVERAAQAGADAVKFQTFRTAEMTTGATPKARYQLESTDSAESYFEMGRRLELDRDAHLAIREQCRDVGIEFLSTAFDDPSIALLEELDVPVHKIPSGEITNLPYLRRIGSLGKPILMSTGMADIEEVAAAVDVLKKSGANLGEIVLLHCTTEYPAPAEETNLRAMSAMRDRFGTEVGYSDHTLGIEVSVAAVAMGARVIEKHLTLDRSRRGPDHAASLEPDQFGAMTRAIRLVESALGDGVKRPSPSELRNRDIARRSIVARRAIRAGETMTEANLTTKRPGTGLSPMRWDDVVGHDADRDYEADEMIEL